LIRNVFADIAVFRPRAAMFDSVVFKLKEFNVLIPKRREFQFTPFRVFVMMTIDGPPILIILKRVHIGIIDESIRESVIVFGKENVSSQRVPTF